MANSPNKKGKYNRKSVWGELSVSDWISLLGDLAPASTWIKKGKSLVGSSPYAATVDKTPSCYIVTDKKFVKCFSTGVYETDPLRFISAVANISWVEAFNYLRKKFGLRSLPAKLSDELQKKELDHSIKEQLAVAMNDALVFAAEALNKNPNDKSFRFAVPCISYLKKRGIPAEEEYLRNLPIGVLPPLLLLKALITTNFENCVKMLQNWLTAEYVGSLAFFYHGTPSSVSSIRLRADFLRPDNRKDIVKIAGSSEDGTGFFGLKHYAPLLGKNTGGIDTEALIMEGEFDALANMAGQIRDGKPYDIVLATGGAAETHLDSLEEFGVKRCLITADSPNHGGDTITKNLLKSNTIPMQVFSWPGQVRAKDPFDAVEIHGWDLWITTLMDRDPDGKKRIHYEYPHKWALRKLKEAMSHSDPDDVRKIKDFTADLGSCLNSPVEQRAYINEASAVTSLSVSEINEIVVGREETEEGYIRRILVGLKEHYMFIGLDTSSTSGAKVHVWHKGKRELRVWSASRSQEMFGTLNADLGGMIFWAREKIGIPDWMTHKRTSRGTVPISILEQEALQTRYVKMAIDELMKELPTLDKLRELKAGCHYVPVTLGEETLHRWCIVNGNDVYLGTPNESEGINWRRLDGPRIGNYYFNLSRQRWSNEIRSVKDLYQGLEADIEETFDFLVAIINKGWNFRHQYEDSEYLAAAMMINSVCSALPRQIYTMINGSRGSGKSSFLGLLTGGNPEMRLVEAAFGMDNYTVAGFRKEMNNCSLGAVLDEFEDTGNDSQSRHVREILRDIRGLTSNPESRIIRGNAESRESTEYTLRCQLWCAAIQYLRDEADVSRFVQIHTELSEGHPNPKVTLAELFSPADFRKHRRCVTTGMFKYVKPLLENIRELRAIYSSPKVMAALREDVEAEIPSRYLDGVLIPAALLQLVRRNPHDFVRRFIRAKAPYLKRVVQTTHKHTLLDHVLSGQIEYKRPNSETRHTTIRTLLSDATERYLLNETDCGVRYIEFQPKGTKNRYERRWLIVIWSDSLHGVLRGVPQYRYETASRLKQLADSDHSMTVPSHAIKQVPGGIRKYLKVGVRSSDYTVYDLSEIIQDWDTPEMEA